MPSFFPEMSSSITSYIVQIVYIALAWVMLHLEKLWLREII